MLPSFIRHAWAVMLSNQTRLPWDGVYLVWSPHSCS